MPEPTRPLFQTVSAGLPFQSFQTVSAGPPFQSYGLITCAVGLCSISGVLPPAIGRLPLLYLNLSENAINGQLPFTWDNLTRIQSL